MWHRAKSDPAARALPRRPRLLGAARCAAAKTARSRSWITTSNS